MAERRKAIVRQKVLLADLIDACKDEAALSRVMRTDLFNKSEACVEETKITVEAERRTMRMRQVNFEARSKQLRQCRQALDAMDAKTASLPEEGGPYLENILSHFNALRALLQSDKDKREAFTMKPRAEGLVRAAAMASKRRKRGLPPKEAPFGVALGLDPAVFGGGGDGAPDLMGAIQGWLDHSWSQRGIPGATPSVVPGGDSIGHMSGDENLLKKTPISNKAAQIEKRREAARKSVQAVRGRVEVDEDEVPVWNSGSDDYTSAAYPTRVVREGSGWAQEMASPLNRDMRHRTNPLNIIHPSPSITIHHHPSPSIIRP